MVNLKNFSPSFDIENSYPSSTIIGIDEAGRGPLAGPVIAGLAQLDKDFQGSEMAKKINDSKKLSAKKRQEIFAYLQKNIKFAIGIVEAETIDEINILQATKLAMKRAYEEFVEKYQILPQIVLVDGNFVPFKAQDQIREILPIIKGDQKSLSIAAGSIVAKETRDKIMADLHQEFPQYNWDKNAAYPTKAHIDAIKEFGICKHHRKSFNPIKSMLES